jgi:hypothetical protein
LRSPVQSYEAPPWLRARAGTELRWRVAALGAGGRTRVLTPWRRLRLPPDSAGFR